MGVEEEVFLGSKAGIDGERTGRDFLFDILGNGGILSNEKFIIINFLNYCAYERNY